MDSIAGLAEQLRTFTTDHQYYFNLCHIIVCVLSIRKDAGRSYAFNHPLASWVSSVITVLAGSIVANPLLGKPILSAFEDQHLIFITSVIHFLINYFPGDVFYGLITVTPIYASICTAKEIQRGIKVLKGLLEGVSFNGTGNFIIPVLIATIKGNGAGFLTPFTRMIRGATSSNEIIKPSVTTKMCSLLAVGLFVLDPTYPTSKEMVYLCSVGMFITVKLSGIFGEPVDPFKPFENIVFGILGNIKEDQPKSKAE